MTEDRKMKEGKKGFGGDFKVNYAEKERQK